MAKYFQKKPNKLSGMFSCKGLICNNFNHVQLNFAISFGHMRILKFLIENGASIDFKAFDGATALTYPPTSKRKWLISH